MRFGHTARLTAAAGFGLVLLLSAPTLSAAADEKGKRVTTPTADGVDLSGTYYAAKDANKKDYCVILLHDFSAKKGGDSHADDMDKLAEDLQDQGYNVVSCDFRGFGESKNVRADVFWTFA